MDRTPTQYAMVIDSGLCIDCKACMVACKVANATPRGFFRNWVREDETDFSRGPRTATHFQPGACMHCDNPTCVTACPTGATYKDRNDGVVLIDRGLCIGCGNCVTACPYGARFLNPTLKVADKCDFCAERRAAGLAPACVDTCPTKARVFGDIRNPASVAARMLRENPDAVVRLLPPKTDTRPNMYYLTDTAPLHWPAEPKDPPAMTAWAGIVNPLVKTLVGLSGLGVLAMLGRQILGRRQPPAPPAPPQHQPPPASAPTQPADQT